MQFPSGTSKYMEGIQQDKLNSAISQNSKIKRQKTWIWISALFLISTIKKKDDDVDGDGDEKEGEGRI